VALQEQLVEPVLQLQAAEEWLWMKEPALYCNERQKE
jgi:hypothetical protein